MMQTKEEELAPLNNKQREKLRAELFRWTFNQFMAADKKDKIIIKIIT